MHLPLDFASSFTLWQWAVLGLAATGSGLSKTGIPGVNVLSVALFAMALPARASTGVVLPLLLCADVFAVTTFRRQADWPQLIRLFPWAGAGVIAGWLAMGRLQGDKNFSRLMGAVLLLLVIVQLARSQQGRKQAAAQSPVTPPSPTQTPETAGTPDVPNPANRVWSTVIGCLAGFTTMVANAAGPLMIIFLLGRRMERTALMGTAAWFFFCVNLFKVPFSVQMGLITPRSLVVDLCLAPCAVGGAWLGRLLLPRLKQQHFEGSVLFFAFVAALRLLF